jgi:creatinine amidohydrolase/Fe(II)-dependent formamide hydrolase-like protein
MHERKGGSLMSYEQSPVRPGEWRFERLTWPEINTAVAEQRAIILPIGSVEQHGYHLPLDVDMRLSTAVCHGAGQALAGEALVMPSACYGYCHHVMDFPGTMNIEPTTFVKYHLDITRSLAYHGFKRIILVNGHGSNGPLVEQVGRQTNLQTDALCCTFSWWQLVADYWNAELRDSTIPGGCAHACELETAMYMHIAPEDVRSRAVAGGRSHRHQRPRHDRRVDLDLLPHRLLRRTRKGDRRERPPRLRPRRPATRRPHPLVPRPPHPPARRPPRRRPDVCVAVPVLTKGTHQPPGRQEERQERQGRGEKSEERRAKSDRRKKGRILRCGSE